MTEQANDNLDFTDIAGTAADLPADAALPGATDAQLDASVAAILADAQLAQPHQDLVKILTTKRKHGTVSEKDFVHEWLVKRIAELGYAAIFKEENVVVTVPLPDGGMPKTLFSCHTDTVHWNSGEQSIVFDPNFGHIALEAGTPSPAKPGALATRECLGADDGAGIWLMLQMIEAKVPGSYIFHRGEECGCIGSKAMALKQRTWLENFKAAVAFDRPKDFEVITHQLSRTRCASDAYGKALAQGLNDAGAACGHKLEYVPSDAGVVTDTAQYRSVIPECVNIGVGYYNQHGADEYLDYDHLLRLRDAILKLDWEALPIERKPFADVGGSSSNWGNYPRSGFGQRSFMDEEITDTRGSKGGGKKPSKSQGRGVQRRQAPIPAPAVEPTAAEELDSMTIDEITDMCCNHPDMMSSLIVELLADLEAEKVRATRLRRAIMSMREWTT